MKFIACKVWLDRGIKKRSLVGEVLQEWEGIVNRVAKSRLGGR